MTSPAEAEMKNLAVVLAMALIVIDLPTLTGLPLESLLPNHRCRCRKQTSDVIGIGKINFIEVIPQGIQCRRKEIILTMKNKRRACVDPSAPWIQILLLKLVKSTKINAVQVFN